MADEQKKTATKRVVVAAEATVLGRMRRALNRMRSPWAMLEALLVAVGVAVVAVWLEIPDRSAAQITMSFAVAIGGVVVFALAQSYVLTLIRRRGGDRVAVWKGALLLVGVWVVSTVVTTVFDAGQMQDVARATEWSLRPGVSAVLSADTMVMLQGIVWSTLRCLVLAALLPFAMEGAATGMRGRWMQRAGWLLLEPMYWGVVMGCAAGGAAVTQAMLHVRPQVPVLMEILLTVTKVVVIFAVDTGALCFALSMTGTFLRDAQLLMRARPEARPSSGRRQRR